MLAKCCERYSDWSVFVLRFGVGIIFLIHGLGKLFAIGPIPMGIDKTVVFLTSVGFSAPIFWAWTLALVETIGGLFVLVGFWTRYAAIPLAIIMFVAIFTVHWANGFNAMTGGYEYALLMIFNCIVLTLTGAGKKLVLEKRICGKEC